MASALDGGPGGPFFAEATKGMVGVQGASLRFARPRGSGMGCNTDLSHHLGSLVVRGGRGQGGKAGIGGSVLGRVTCSQTNNREGAVPASSPGTAHPTSGFRGIYNTAPATRWEDAFVSGNGDSGIMIYGGALDGTIVFNHHKFIRPKGLVHLPPDMTPVLEPVRDKCSAVIFSGVAGLISPRNGERNEFAGRQSDFSPRVSSEHSAFGRWHCSELSPDLQL